MKSTTKTQIKKVLAELLIRKNRNGETGTIYLASQLDMCRFKDLINYNPPPEMNQKSYRSKRDYE